MERFWPKMGDIIRVTADHHYKFGAIGVVLGDFSKSRHNAGKAYRIRFFDGTKRTCFTKNFEVISESR